MSLLFSAIGLTLLAKNYNNNKKIPIAKVVGIFFVIFI
jgi:hypothetical protein